MSESGSGYVKLELGGAKPINKGARTKLLFGVRDAESGALLHSFILSEDEGVNDSNTGIAGLNDQDGFFDWLCGQEFQEGTVFDSDWLKLKVAVYGILEDSLLESSPTPDMVDHPSHYQAGDLEAIDVIEAFCPNSFHLGNAVKYILRAGKKGDAVEDLRKAIWYLERHIERMK